MQKGFIEELRDRRTGEERKSQEGYERGKDARRIADREKR